MNQSYAETKRGRNKSPEQLMTQLKSIWREKHVPIRYQTIFKDCLTQIPRTKVNQIIQAQIELTINHQSFYFTFNSLSETKTLILQKLKKLLLQLQSKDRKTERDIQQVCDVLDDLREINMEFAELLFNIHRYFQQNCKQQSWFSTIASQFSKLDQDLDFLKKSVLRKFILFSKAYDPFFLKHLQLLNTTNNPRLKQVRCIQQFFTLSINYQYRLQKLHKSILPYLMRKKPLQDENPNNFRVISPIHNSSRLKQKYSYFSPSKSQDKSSKKHQFLLEESLNTFKLDRDAYFTNRAHSNNRHTDQLYVRKGSQDNQSSPDIDLRSNSIKHQGFPRLKTLQSTHSKDSKITKQSSIITKRYNIYKSLNQMKQRDQQIKKLIFPKKTEKKMVNKPYLKSLKRQENSTVHNRQISVQCDENNFEQIPTPKQVSVQTVQTEEKKPEKTLKASKMQQKSPKMQEKNRIINDESKKQKYKKYQLKASNMPVDKIFEALKSLELHNNYKRTLETGCWDVSIKRNQYYFHKFFINDELVTVALSYALPQGDISIKLWGPLAGCDQEMSNFLMGKYIEHIEKSTLSKCIYYNGFPINELPLHKFIFVKQRIYRRERINTSQCDPSNANFFLSLNFTCVAINKSIPDQQKLLYTKSNAPQFHINKFICFNYLLIINKLVNSGAFNDVSAYYPRLPSIRQSNLKIISHQLSEQPYNSQFKCSYCHLLTLKLRNPIFSSYFLVDKGYIKILADIVEDSQEKVIVCVPLLRHNVKIYFGKGINNAAEMAEYCRKRRQKSQKDDKISISIRMFKKKLRGRMLSINLKEENTYGDFEVVFQWRDYLRGKIEHNILDSDEIFDKSFYCLIEMERELLFVFEVQTNNFLQ